MKNFIIFLLLNLLIKYNSYSNSIISSSDSLNMRYSKFEIYVGPTNINLNTINSFTQNNSFKSAETPHYFWYFGYWFGWNTKDNNRNSFESFIQKNLRAGLIYQSSTIDGIFDPLFQSKSEHPSYLIQSSLRFDINFPIKAFSFLKINPFAGCKFSWYELCIGKLNYYDSLNNLKNNNSLLFSKDLLNPYIGIELNYLFQFYSIKELNYFSQYNTTLSFRIEYMFSNPDYWKYQGSPVNFLPTNYLDKLNFSIGIGIELNELPSLKEDK